eukprot:m.71426 g.71426  ORF g.71426 m.71426 type:complete len:394 (-) comp14215_c0_seq1:65-1246(-)
MSLFDPQWIPPRLAARSRPLPAGWQQLCFESRPFYLNQQQQRTTFVDPRLDQVLPACLQRDAFPPHWELDFDGDEEPFFLNHRKQDTERRPRWLTEEQHEELNALYMQIYTHQSLSNPGTLSTELAGSTDSLAYPTGASLSDPASGQSTPPRLPPSYKVHLSGGPLHQSARRTLISPQSMDSEGSDDDVELASIDQLRQASTATLLESNHSDADFDVRLVTPAADNTGWTLPKGWAQHSDGSNAVYFVHASTRRVTWTHPGWLQERYGLKLEELPVEVDVTVDELGLVFHDHRTRSACRSISSAPSTDSIPSLSSSLSDAVSLASSLGDMVTGAVSGAVRRVSAYWTPSPVLPQFHEGSLAPISTGKSMDSPPKLSSLRLEGDVLTVVTVSDV